MKISIVTLSFNQGLFLRQAIESVISQGYKDLEYIIVDPGSTDGSREIIQHYSEQVAHVILEKDKGAADGLNKGFSRATGDVYGFLNADDLLLPGSLQRVADFFGKNQQYDIAFGNGYIIDGQGRRLRHVMARNFTVHRYFRAGSRFLQQATFFRAETYKQSPRFNIDNRTCWDGELFVSMVDQGARVGYIPADLGTFRLHDASISGSGKTIQEYLADCRRIFQNLEGRNWKRNDDVMRFVYRTEGLLIKTASWLRDLGSRQPE